MSTLVSPLPTPMLPNVQVGSLPVTESGENLFSREQRLSFLRRFGDHSQHFTGLQPGMSYFDMPAVGYLAFRRQWRRALVLGDPVADNENQSRLISAFLKRHPGAAFIQVSEPTAKFLSQNCRYFGTQFGIEQRVPLADWTISGKSRKGIRKAVNKAHLTGVTVSESESPAEVDDICAQWLETRRLGGFEIEFLVRPRRMPHVAGTRYFHAWKDGVPMGFAWFDPGYQDDKVVSYLPNVSRANPEFSQGIFYTIMVHAMEVFKSEGVQWLDLGLNPMVIDEAPKAFESHMLRSAFQLVYRYGRHYNFQGLHFTKSRFGGELSPTFLCHSRAFPVADLARLAALTGLFSRKPKRNAA